MILQDEKTSQTPSHLTQGKLLTQAKLDWSSEQLVSMGEGNLSDPGYLHLKTPSCQHRARKTRRESREVHWR